MCTVVISILESDELFSPEQLIIVPSRLLVTFIIIMVDTKGSAPGEETRENVKLAEFIVIGKIVGFRSKLVILLVSVCPNDEIFHTTKMWFVLHIRVVCCSPGHIVCCLSVVNAD